MTQLHVEERDWIMAGLGKENSLPHFSFQDPVQTLWGLEGMAATEVERLPDRIRNVVMPYRVQDGYDRDQQPTRIPVIRLENEHLRCLFYPTVGGRLASIVNKTDGRDLLFDNPVYQPANLAIRNAWISGHVEWNGPMYGHNAHSIVPVFVACLDTERGPLLRIYEFDRTLEIVWQVDVILPAHDHRLWVHTTLRNTTDVEQDVFWWTNIGVSVDDQTRFMAGAVSGVSHTIDHHLFRLNFPHFTEGDDTDFDGSYPGRYMQSRSVFLDMPSGQWPWMARLSGDGSGMAHCSTPDFSGRKLFTWGSSPGARRWLDFLSRPGSGDYLEIQAGLTANQFEVYPIAARGQLEWTECFLPLELDPAVAHDADYARASAATHTQLVADVPQEDIQQMDHFLQQLRDHPVDEVLSRGASWGQLHERVCGPVSPGLRFDGPISEEAGPWAELIRTGSFGEATETLIPGSWQSTPTWRKILEQAIQKHDASWLHHLHLAVIDLAAESFDAARGHLEASLACRPNPVACRCLALLEEREGRIEAAAEYYATGWSLSDADPHLAVEIVQFHTRHGRDQALFDFLDILPAQVQAHERIQLALARQALERGDADRVEQILAQPFVTIREGETTLTDLWRGLHTARARGAKGSDLTDEEIEAVHRACPVPDRLNFMVRSDESYLSG